ncbi:MAG TPA: hypothetical protein VFT84_08205 [Gemmatimonadales bacterium]|nr:hypothetical protein [Gemmatimonadales bacterium]
MTGSANAADTWVVPELGPSLGRLVVPVTEEVEGPLGARLDDIRLRLVTGVFELTGAARSFAAAGDSESAVGTLNRMALLALFEKAVGAAAERIAATVNGQLESAAAESRYPAARARRLALTPEDTRAIAARLGAGGAGYVAALDALEQVARVRPAPREWQEALLAAARRLESAWIALEEGAEREQRHWQGDVMRVRAWRRPVWPLWLVTGLALGGAAYLGLLVGGYLPVPAALEGFTSWWWARL